MSQESRRRLLKSLTLGSGALLAGRSLPDRWARPVVDSVMLPAHAQLSGGVATGQFAGPFEFERAEADAGESVLDLFVRPAEAAPACPRTITGVCLVVLDDGSVTIKICTDSVLTNEYFGSGSVVGDQLTGSAGDYMVSGTFDVMAVPQTIPVHIEGPCPEIALGAPDISITIGAKFNIACCAGGPLP